MAAAFLLALVVVGVAQAAVPEPCQGDPASWCQDTAMVARCRREQECLDLRDSPAPGHGADGAAAAPGRGKKCSMCVKILEQVKAMAGEDPDEEAVEAALGKVCRALGRRLSRVCKSLLRKYREQISEALQGGELPRDTCAAIGFCKA